MNAGSATLATSPQKMNASNIKAGFDFDGALPCDTNFVSIDNQSLAN